MRRQERRRGCRQRLSSWSLEKPPTGWGPHLCLSAPKARGVVTSVLQLKCKRNPISTATTERHSAEVSVGSAGAMPACSPRLDHLLGNCVYKVLVSLNSFLHLLKLNIIT